MDNENIIILIIGTLIGMVPTLILHKVKIKHEIRIKFFDKFLYIHDEIANCIGDLADLKLYPNYDGIDFKKYQKKISKLYYKYYDFLPQNVLLELNCLNMCLSSKGAYIFIKSQDCLSIEKISIDDKERLYEYIKSVSLVKNVEKLFEKIEHNDNENLFINLQSRKLLRSFNEEFSNNTILKWGKNLKKIEYYN